MIKKILAKPAPFYQLTAHMMARIVSFSSDETILHSIAPLNRTLYDSEAFEKRLVAAHALRCRRQLENLRVWNAYRFHCTPEQLPKTGQVLLEKLIEAELEAVRISTVSEPIKTRLKYEIIKAAQVLRTPEQLRQERLMIWQKDSADEVKMHRTEILYQTFPDILTPAFIRQEHDALWASDIPAALKVYVIESLYQAADKKMSPADFQACRELLISVAQNRYDLLRMYAQDNRYLTPSQMRQERQEILDSMVLDDIKIRLLQDLYRLSLDTVPESEFVEEIAALDAQPSPLNEMLRGILTDRELVERVYTERYE